MRAPGLTDVAGRDLPAAAERQGAGGAAPRDERDAVQHEEAIRLRVGASLGHEAPVGLEAKAGARAAVQDESEAAVRAGTGLAVSALPRDCDADAGQRRAVFTHHAAAHHLDAQRIEDRGVHAGLARAGPGVEQAHSVGEGDRGVAVDARRRAGIDGVVEQRLGALFVAAAAPRGHREHCEEDLDT